MTPEAYQNARETLLDAIERLRAIRDELTSRDPYFVNSLPSDVRQKIVRLDREVTRLRNPDLTVAFVGGFSSGKSSLVNAFLGRYLLPESTKITTAVPTFVRATTEKESAELHYLSDEEVGQLGEMYRQEIANIFGRPDLVKMPFASLLDAVESLATEGRGYRLVEQFKQYHRQRHERRIEQRGRVVNVTIPEAQKIIRDENEAMFLDRVVLHISGTPLPPDVIIVDLPGVSVPNPRHREITFRFVREEAHAVVFVLMATRLFDKDELEIMELFLSGDRHIAEKTFWVLNRWDTLSPQHQSQTIADFEAKMREFGIPIGYRWFRTNALHGLLAQLAKRNEQTDNPALEGHLRDYKSALSSRYGNSHDIALQESQIPQLQKEVFSFLNERLRETTLRSAYENAKFSFGQPIPHHIRRVLETDDVQIRNTLQREEKEESHKRVEQRFTQRLSEIREKIKELRNDIAVKRSAILIERTNELVDTLRKKIEDGPETDAFQIYQEIIAEQELRKYPYHFEIEMRIVDKLNTMLKQSFRSIVRSQVESVFEELTKKITDALEEVRKDVAYNAEVMAPFDEIIRDEAHSFRDRVDGVVMTLAAQLDGLLVFKPKRFFGYLGGNEVLDGLEKAARMGFESLSDPGQAIQEKDFTEKTRQIRQTLTGHYIEKVREYHERITHDIVPIVINNMQQIEKRLEELMQAKYRPALELIFSKEVGEEFAAKRKELEERTRRFRNTIDEIESLMAKMERAMVTAGMNWETGETERSA